MKPFFSILILFFQLCCLNAQIFKTPNIEFGGSKVDWKYRVEDSSEVQESTNLPFLRKEESNIWNSPIEIGGTIIYNVDNFNPYTFGNIISCYDTKTGEQKWLRYINPSNEDGYCYNFYHSMLKDTNGELILTGARSSLKSSFTQSQNNDGGRFIRWTLNSENGQTIDKYLREDIFSYKLGDLNPALSGGKELYYHQAGPPLDKSYSDRFYPYFIDIKNNLVINRDGLDTTSQLLFNTFNNSGISNNIRIDGPYSDTENEYTYIVQYEKNRVANQYLWKIDKDAKIIYSKDISESLRGADKREQYVRAEQKDGKIFLTMVKLDNTIQGNRGYAILDMDGNLIKKNTSITIGDKKAGHISTTPLKGSEELLHVIRFQNDKDVFLYRETKDKTYIKAGQLENKNSKAYAYIPLYLLQTSDEGIVISGSFFMDTVVQNYGSFRFDQGAWPVIMKLSAATLGLPSSTQDGSYTDALFTISPNPSTNRVTITIPEIHHANNIYITDQTGRCVLQNRESSIITELDISALQAGMYFVSLTDDAGRSVGRVEKLVKM